MKVISDNKSKIEFSVTDILKSELAIIKAASQEGRVLRITDGDGRAAAVTMDDKAMVRLQRYLNKVYPTEAEKSRIGKARKASRIIKASKIKAEQFGLIAQAVCQEMNLTLDVVLGGMKFRELCDARKIITYLAKKYANMSYPEIADMFGEKTRVAAMVRIKAYDRFKHERLHNGRTLHKIAETVKQELRLM